MDNITYITTYSFELLEKLVDVINSSIILQFGVLITFGYFAVNALKKVISDNNDSDGKGGIAI